MAEKYGLSKDQLDTYSYESHQRAIAATQAGKFKDEIVSLQITRADNSTDTHHIDEGIRFDASLDGIKGVKLIAENGKHTAASASQICDGASGVLVVNERGLKSLGVKPLARIHHMTMMGGDPVIMLDAPLHATKRALEKAGMSIDDIDLFEVNEAFAAVPVALAEDDRRRSGTAQRQWRRDRARPSARRLRHQADDHAGQCTQAEQQALRPADHVRRRRHGQRDHRRAALKTRKAFGDWRAGSALPARHFHIEETPMTHPSIHARTYTEQDRLPDGGDRQGDHLSRARRALEPGRASVSFARPEGRRPHRAIDGKPPRLHGNLLGGAARGSLLHRDQPLSDAGRDRLHRERLRRKSLHHHAEMRRTGQGPRRPGRRTAALHDGRARAGLPFLRQGSRRAAGHADPG